MSGGTRLRYLDYGNIPELWLLSHHKIQLCGPYLEKRDGDIPFLVQTS
jgi:hypothetical protein